jgi:flavin-dependent dehydrogenase
LLEGLGIGRDTLTCVPLREARFLDARGHGVEARSEEPYAWLVRRGSAPGTLDQALARKARDLGVRIRCGEALAPEHADVLATGMRRVDGLAIERMFATASPDRVDVLLDEELAPGGYAYLFVHEGEATLGIAALGAFKDLDRRLERARARFVEIADFDEIAPRSAAHGMNFALPLSAIEGHRPRVGEAAGFQDFLFGLGLRMALVSGELAARARLEGRDYDALWSAELGPRLRTSLVDRWLYERGLVRRELMRRMRSNDLRELLDDLQREHWAKSLLLPWVLRHRLQSDAQHGLVPRRKEARA